MAYLTDKETLERFEYYTMEVEKRLMQGEDFKTIADQIPFGVHLNDPITLAVIHTNKMHEQLTGHHIDQIREMGLEFLDKHIHPKSMEMVSEVLPPLYSSMSSHQTFLFIQYVKLRGDTHFSPVITFTKSTKLEDGMVVCLSPKPSDFDSIAPKMEQIVRMDQFKLKNFSRFKQLTQREIEILKMLAGGMNNPEIAAKLFVSRQTVETHRKHIIKKLDICSYRDLIKYALAFDLISI